MKNTLILVLLSLSTAMFAQFNPDMNDFFEVGVNIGTYNETQTDVSTESQSRAIVSSDLSYMGAGLKYGKGILPFAHIVFSATYSRREVYNTEGLGIYEDRIEFESLEKMNVNAASAAIGPRIRVIGLEVFEWSIGGAGFARIIPSLEDNLEGGYHVYTVIGINFNRRIQGNVQYGYEKTIAKNKGRSLPLELAIHYKIY